MYEITLTIINKLLMSEQFAPFTTFGFVLMIIMSIAVVVAGSSEED